MMLMEKNGQRKLVFDCFIPQYRADGWKADGETDNVQSPSESSLEKSADEVENDTSTIAGDGQGDNQTVDEVADKPFVCPKCGKEYSKEASLKAHITKCHAEQ